MRRDKYGQHFSWNFSSPVSIRTLILQREASSNPMAIVVLAQLQYLESKNKTAEIKYDVKIALIRMLYRKGYTKKQILKLFNFIDWLIALPAHLEEKITDEIIKIEEVEKMTYVTSVERIGEKRGIKIGEKKGIKIGEKKGEKIGEKIGEDRITKKIAKKMLKRGDSIEDVIELTDLTREEVLVIKKEMDS